MNDLKKQINKFKKSFAEEDHKNIKGTSINTIIEAFEKMKYLRMKYGIRFGKNNWRVG